MTPRVYEKNEHKLIKEKIDPAALFIIETLRKLEPRIEIKGSVIFEELDEINEIIFI